MGKLELRLVIILLIALTILIATTCEPSYLTPHCLEYGDKIWVRLDADGEETLICRSMAK
jgi:hypothetical protein